MPSKLKCDKLGGGNGEKYVFAMTWEKERGEGARKDTRKFRLLLIRNDELLRIRRVEKGTWKTEDSNDDFPLKPTLEVSYCETATKGKGNANIQGQSFSVPVGFLRTDNRPNWRTDELEDPRKCFRHSDSRYYSIVEATLGITAGISRDQAQSEVLSKTLGGEQTAAAKPVVSKPN